MFIWPWVSTTRWYVGSWKSLFLLFLKLCPFPLHVERRKGPAILFPNPWLFFYTSGWPPLLSQRIEVRDLLLFDVLPPAACLASVVRFSHLSSVTVFLLLCQCSQIKHFVEFYVDDFSVLYEVTLYSLESALSHCCLTLQKVTVYHKS